MIREEGAKFLAPPTALCTPRLAVDPHPALDRPAVAEDNRT
jgi:hypothetical protein